MTDKIEQAVLAMRRLIAGFGDRHMDEARTILADRPAGTVESILSWAETITTSKIEGKVITTYRPVDDVLIELGIE